ncbi:endonuclease domain-containing protein [Gordonia sp. NPDC058843]|uniref:endonuclease domain-containing protein n=1 Tax=Gordonia sp. NPDC058843 TaxID=3346648 RepID=UPI0036BB5678
MADALEFGLTRSAVRRRVTAGVWQAGSRGGFTLADHPDTARTRARLAVAAVGRQAALSGLGAAWWHGVADDAAVLDAALLQRKVSISQLRATAERRRRCEGASMIASLVAGVDSGARSAAERLALGLLRTAGVDGWVCDHPVGGYFVDIAFPDRKLAVEIDGMAFHRDAKTFQRDRRRRNDLIALGWTVLNVTWNDLRERPGYVVERIEAALTAA